MDQNFIFIILLYRFTPIKDLAFRLNFLISKLFLSYSRTIFFISLQIFFIIIFLFWFFFLILFILNCGNIWVRNWFHSFLLGLYFRLSLENYLEFILLLFQIFVHISILFIILAKHLLLLLNIILWISMHLLNSILTFLPHVVLISILLTIHDIKKIYHRVFYSFDII